MKIQNFNSWNNQPNTTKNIKASNNGFENVLKSQLQNDKSIENILPSPHSVSTIEQTDSVKPLALSNMKPIQLSRLENLIKDAFSDNGKQILREIDSLCADETGENIDMKLLDELLKLYEESQ